MCRWEDGGKMNVKEMVVDRIHLWTLQVWRLWRREKSVSLTGIVPRSNWIQLTIKMNKFDLTVYMYMN
jgi:hypothetical protein